MKKSKMIKKIVTCLLLAVFVLGAALPAFAEENGSMTTDSNDEPIIYDTGANPLWSIESVELLTEAAIGQKFEVQIVARNIGSGDGFMPIIEFTEDEKELKNFSVAGGGSTYDPGIEKVKSGDAYTFNVTLEVSANAREVEGQGYKLNAILKSYNWNISGERMFSASKQFYVSPKYSLSSPTFVVRDVKFSPEVTADTEVTKATFYIENVSDAKARDVKISLLGKELNDKGDRNIAIKDLSNVKLGYDVDGGQVIMVDYELELNAGRKDNEMTMTVDFNGAEKAQEIVVNLPLPLSNNTGKVPKVIINKYTVSPSKAYAGSQVTLTLYIENTNEKDVRNIQISLKVPENEGSSSNTVVSSGTVFSPVDSSNTFYIDSIPGKSIAKKEITMYVDSNATAKTYVVPVSINYESLDGEAYNAEDNVNIPVGQVSQIDVITQSVATEVMAGSPADFSIEFVNSGKVAVSNFKAYLKGDSPVFDNQVYYIGKFDVGATDSFSGSFIPDTVGELSGSMVLSYVTGDNEEVVSEYPFTVNVTEMVMPEPDPMDPGMMEPVEPSFAEKVKTHIKDIVLVGVIVVLAGVIIRDRRKKKKDEELLDE